MSEPESVDLSDQNPVAPKAAVPRRRAIGSPLPRGVSSRAPLSAEQGNVERLTQAPPPGRALGGAPAEEPSSSLQRGVSSLRSALPFVQRILPLLDGNIAATVANLLAPHPRPQAPTPPPPLKIDLVPLEDRLAELQTQHRDLRDQVMEQNTSLQRVEDQLAMVREATDRNTLEQQELLEDLKSFGNKVKFVIIALGLVAIAFLLNLILYLHFQRVLP